MTTFSISCLLTKKHESQKNACDGLKSKLWHVVHHVSKRKLLMCKMWWLLSDGGIYWKQVWD